MRVKVKGVDSYGPSCTFEFNEKKLEGVIGDSIASALINTGEYGLRNTEGQLKNRFLNRCSLSLTSLDKRSEYLARFSTIISIKKA